MHYDAKKGGLLMMMKPVINATKLSKADADTNMMWKKLSSIIALKW